MRDFDEWIQKTIPKWSNQVIKLGASWDTFKQQPKNNTDDILLSDLVGGGIPLLSARDIVTKAREVIQRKNSPLAVYWDFDTIPIPATLNLKDLVTRLKSLLSSYGQPINFHGYSRNISTTVTEEQRYQLSSDFGFVLIDSSSLTASGKEVATKRIIIDVMKSESSSSTASSLSMCFISADVDISYLLSILDRPQVFKILISNSESLTNISDLICNVKLQWDSDVLNPKKNAATNGKSGSISTSTTTSRGGLEKKPVTSYAAAVASTAPTPTPTPAAIEKKNIPATEKLNESTKVTRAATTTTASTVPTKKVVDTSAKTPTLASPVKSQQQQLSKSDISLLTAQVVAAALDLGDGQKHSALKSRVGSLLRLADPKRFPTREDLAVFLSQAVDDGMCIETGYGEYKILTIPYNGSNGKTVKCTPPIEITKRVPPLSLDELPGEVITLGESTRPYIIFVPWSVCINRAVFPPKAHVHTTEKWAMLMFETLIAAQQAAVEFTWIRESGDFLIDFRRVGTSTNTNVGATSAAETDSNKHGKSKELARDANDKDDVKNEGGTVGEVETGEEEIVADRKPHHNNQNGTRHQNNFEQSDEQQIRVVVTVMEMLLKSDELYVSEPVLKYQLAARRGGDGNDNKQYFYWIEKAVVAGSLLLFRRPGVPKGRFYCLPNQLENSRAACSPNDIDTYEEEKHIVNILVNTPSDRWVTRKSLIESLQASFPRMKNSPALRVRVFQNAAKKELFFVAKDGSTQVVAQTKDDAYAYLKKAVAKRDSYNASVHHQSSNNHYHNYHNNNNISNSNTTGGYGKKYNPNRSSHNSNDNNYRTTGSRQDATVEGETNNNNATTTTTTTATAEGAL